MTAHQRARAHSAGGITLLVLVMLALATSPTSAKALAPCNADRVTESRAVVGGELAIRLERRVLRERIQPAEHAALVVLVISPTSTDSPRPPTSVSIAILRIREALLALPPPVC